MNENVSYSKNQFKSTEMRLAQHVIGMTEAEAIEKITERQCLAFVVRRDKLQFKSTIPTAHSYRINLEIVKGKVIRTFIG